MPSGESLPRAGLILSGGKSSRMGVNKAFVRLRGLPAIRWVADSLSQIVGSVIVSISGEMDPEEYRMVLPDGITIISDKWKSGSPLVGIESGLLELPDCYCAILSCDVPLVSSRVVSKLFFEGQGYEAAIPQWPDGRIEPLHAIYHSSSAREAAHNARRENELSNKDMIKRLEKVKFIPTEELRSHDPNLSSLFNMNSQRDVERAELILNDRQKHGIR